LHLLLSQAIQQGKISKELKEKINNPKNYYMFKGLIPANTTEQLKELIKIG
jgi:ethanolamine utilization cobalamin adenosyltransferase